MSSIIHSYGLLEAVINYHVIHMPEKNQNGVLNLIFFSLRQCRYS